MLCLCCKFFLLYDLFNKFVVVIVMIHGFVWLSTVIILNFFIDLAVLTASMIKYTRNTLYHISLYLGIQCLKDLLIDWSTVISGIPGLFTLANSTKA